MINFIILIISLISLIIGCLAYSNKIYPTCKWNAGIPTSESCFCGDSSEFKNIGHNGICHKGQYCCETPGGLICSNKICN